MAQFQPGVSGNPLGPAPYRDLASLGYWLRRFEKELKSRNITPGQRCRLQLDIIQLLMSRKEVLLPKSVRDEPTRKSGKKALEDLVNGRSGTDGSDTVRLGDGPATVQAKQDPA